MLRGSEPRGDAGETDVMKSKMLFLVMLACLSLNPSNAAERNGGTGAESSERKEVARHVNVGVAEFAKLREKRDSVVLDVRSAEEFQSGHIPGALNVDVNSSGFREKIAKLDKSKTYLVHCAAGVRSVKACKILAPLKFEKLVNLEGGFNAWEKAGQPVEK